MNEIKCPHCQTVFTIDENSYADIVSQVRNKEFAEDLPRSNLRRKRHSQKSKKSVYMMRNVPALNRRFFLLN